MHRLTPTLLLTTLLVAGCNPAGSSASVGSSGGRPSTARSAAPARVDHGTSTARTSTAGSSAAASGSPSSAAPSTGKVADIKVYANCRKPRIEPRVIILACADAGVLVVNLRWSNWTTTHARGIGTLRYNDCKPNCATGHFHDVPGTRITLTRAVPDVNGQLVWSRSRETPLPPGWATGPLRGAPQPLPTEPT